MNLHFVTRDIEASFDGYDTFDLPRVVCAAATIYARIGSDMRIDGYTFEGHFVQVKQLDDIGRNVVDDFETAMRRRKATKGIVVAFIFGKEQMKKQQ